MTTRQQVIKRHLQEAHKDAFSFSRFEDRNQVYRVLVEEVKPLYTCPSDFIDEFGRFKVVEHTEEGGLVEEDIRTHLGDDLKSTYTSSINASNVISSNSNEHSNKDTSNVNNNTFVLPKHLETGGENAIEKIKNYMKRRFPERLQQCRSLAESSAKVYTAWRSRTRKREAEWGDPEDLGIIQNDPRPEHLKVAPVYPQNSVNPKSLLPNYFITNLISVGSKLYNSNRPSLNPTTATSRFMANTAVWSPSERKTFIELYLQNPKNFSRISANLPYKSCEQCVEFYYRHKKEYRLKQMVASYRKAMVAQRKLILNTTSNPIPTSNPNPSSNPNPNTNITGNNITGSPNMSNITNKMSAVISNVSNISNISNMNILPPLVVDETATYNSNQNNVGRKKTGRPVGRPKNKQ